MDGVNGTLEVRVPMRDGVVLAADVHLPDGAGPFPVLVHRTAYGRRNPAMVSQLVADPALLVEAGYGVVVQDVRGRGDSAGDWEPFVHEADDGFDTVEWAAAQPWSTGRVGIYGSSYMGITTYRAVAAAPPHLAAAAAWVAGCDPDHGLVRTGGALELGFLAGWNLANDGWAGDLWDVVRHRPLLEHPALVGRPALPAQVHHEPGDRRWRAVTLEPSQVGVPLLQVVGQRDWMAPSALALFRAVQDPAGPHRLVLGPWTHHSAYGGPTGERDLTDRAPGGPVAHTPTLLAFFDQHLRDRRADDDPVVRFFTTGSGGRADTWAEATSWPPPGTTARTWTTGPGGVLDDRAGEPAAGADVLRHDPLDPVPTVGGSCCHASLGPSGIVDRATVANRSDVLCWSTRALDEPVTLAGEVTLELVLTSSAEDADVVVFLVDVHPDGYAEPVTDGVQRTRYRLGATQDWLVPGEPTAVTVPLADVAHTVTVGHRLRVELAGSSFPRFAVNGGTRVLPELADDDDLRPATHRVAHGARLTVRVRA